MSDLYEPYQKLVRIVILGKVFEVPGEQPAPAPDAVRGPRHRHGQILLERGVPLLRDQLLPAGRRTRAGRPGLPPQGPGGDARDEVAFEIKYNMSEALAAAPVADR